MAEFLFGGQRRTPLAPLPSTSPLDGWARPPETGLRATWLGHSTVLVEIDGAARAHRSGVGRARLAGRASPGPKRFQPVPVPIVGAAAARRGDHLARPLRPPRLPDHPRARARRDVPFVTSLGVGAHLEAWGVPAERIIELDWWEHVDLPRHGADRSPPRRRSTSRGRGLGDRNATLWSSFVVRGPRHAFFFSGDTGLTPEYAEIRERLGPFDLVMLEVGAFHPAWGDIHLGPENALEALAAARRRRVPAGALGHVQPRHPRLGRAGRDAARARAEARRAAGDAAPRRARRAVARRAPSSPGGAPPPSSRRPSADGVRCTATSRLPRSWRRPSSGRWTEVRVRRAAS